LVPAFSNWNTGFEEENIEMAERNIVNSERILQDEE